MQQVLLGMLKSANLRFFKYVVYKTTPSLSGEKPCNGRILAA